MLLLIVFISYCIGYSFAQEADDYGVIPPTLCETCKVLAEELHNRFDETGKTTDVLQLTYNLVDESKSGGDSKTNLAKKYRNSELRFIETLDGICDKILQYSVHKEHKNSKRFSKGQSQTMKTLHGLVDRGVKVELGIPYELWDAPSVEVASMKQYCEKIIEDYEDQIESWYFSNDSDRPSLREFLCEKMNFITKLRQLDAYSKPLDDFRIKTSCGGIVTLLSTSIIIVLVFFEFMYYLETDIREELFVDSSSESERVKINFDVTFPRLPCEVISVDAMDVSGDHQDDVAHNVWKISLDKNGKPIENSQIKQGISDLKS
uniref:DUF3456 domain-containing protein n=1 Tax=Romanomermis culicivorax TaxID=13658 RepID=A0A915IP75_ROMCU